MQRAPGEPRLFAVDGKPHVLLASGLGDSTTGGGLYVLTSSGMQQIDAVSSTGIAFSKTRLIRSLRTTTDSRCVELLLYDEKGVTQYLRIDGIADAHDVLPTDQGVMIACSDENSIVSVGLDGRIRDRIDFPGEPDSWHINSLHVHDGSLYTTAFGDFRRYKEWDSAGRNCDGVVMDAHTRRVVLGGLSQPHHPRVEDGLWHICNSGKGEFLAADEKCDEPVRRVTLDGFTRGVAFDSEHIFVGVSASRREPTGATARIAVLDRTTWDVVDVLPVPSQELYEVCFVPAAYLTGLLAGFNTNSLRVAEQNQLGLFQAAGIAPIRLWATADPLPRTAFKARITGTIPPNVGPNTLITPAIVIENLGGAFLVSSPPNPVYASYKWLDADGKYPDDRTARRSPLPASLAPGDSATVPLAIVAPDQPADYALHITLVQEFVAWFDEVHEANALVTRVRVGSRAGDGSTEAAESVSAAADPPGARQPAPTGSS